MTLPADVVRLRRAVRLLNHDDALAILTHDFEHSERVIRSQMQAFRDAGFTEETDIHGVLTGLMVEHKRVIGQGEFAEVVSEYELNQGLLNARLTALKLMHQLDTDPEEAKPASITVQFIERSTV